MNASVPKRAFTFIETKSGEKVYEVCITLKDVRGALSKVAMAISDANLDIRTSSLFLAEDSSGFGYWTSFIDFSKANKSIEQVERDVRKLDVVHDVNIVEPKPLVFDVIHFPIMHGDSTAMIMPVELFGSLFAEIENILKTSGFAAVFYNAGKKSGFHIAELLSKKYGLKGDRLARVFIQSLKAIGWGEVQSFALDRKRLFGRVEIRQCFEALLRVDRKEKVCHWTRGFIAGFLSVVTGEHVEAVETKCRASGDEMCEFEVRPNI